MRWVYQKWPAVTQLALALRLRLQKKIPAFAGMTVLSVSAF
jgi:hypothetical protein